MKVVVKKAARRGGGKGGVEVTLATLDLDKDKATLGTLKQTFAKTTKNKYAVTRQEWRILPEQQQEDGGKKKGGKGVLKLKGDEALLVELLADLGVQVKGNQDVCLYFKDLGPQIEYSTVFFWEYFGPLVIYPLFFLYPKYFYADGGEKGENQDQHALAQKVACAYWVFHYAKRIFETFFVHTFSHATMPIRNLVKNCSYYWGFSALVSYFINHPKYTAVSESVVYPAFACAMACQLANFYCHVLLTRLRANGEKGYKIPRGVLFEYITCPNYTAEILGWFFFNVGTRSLMGYLFMCAGAYQMLLWALAKHKRLKKLFDGKEGRMKYPKRYVMLPPLV